MCTNHSKELLGNPSTFSSPFLTSVCSWLGCSEFLTFSFTIFDTSLQLAWLLRISYLFLHHFRHQSAAGLVAQDFVPFPSPFATPVCSWLGCSEFLTFSFVIFDTSLQLAWLLRISYLFLQITPRSYLVILSINILFTILYTSLQLAWLFRISQLFLLAVMNSILWPVCSWNQCSSIRAIELLL